MLRYLTQSGKVSVKLVGYAWLILLSTHAINAFAASKTLLVVGDSLSAEYGLTRGSGWVALLEKKLKAENIPLTIVNASISGETTSGGGARFPALLKQHQPDVVILELGANDGLRGLPLASMEANLRSMVSMAQNARANVILVGMRLPPNYGQDYTTKFFGVYTKLAKEKRLSFVPFLLEGVADKPQLFLPDRLHPTAQAQSIILENVWPSLQSLIKQRAYAVNENTNRNTVSKRIE